MRFSLRSFWKLFVLSLAISGLLLVVAGCGAKSGGGGGLDEAAIRQEIDARINSFKAAVEAYDVDVMLSFLEETDSEKQLAIAEGGSDPYYKSYERLETELGEDQKKQLHWRKPPAEGGNGYTLTMQLGTITYSNLGASGANAIVPFSIFEAAESPAINSTLTDTGRMTCAMVKTQGEWRCREMAIYFDANPGGAGASSTGAMAVASSQAASRARNNKKSTKGLGFGDLEALIENHGSPK
jgi:hypothetical protein